MQNGYFDSVTLKEIYFRRIIQLENEKLKHRAVGQKQDGFHSYEQIVTTKYYDPHNYSWILRQIKETTLSGAFFLRVEDQ